MNFLSTVFLLLSLALGSFALPPPRPQVAQAFGLVGYAKAGSGSFGETTGGQGGKVFDVTNDQELQHAIKVKTSCLIFCTICSLGDFLMLTFCAG